MSPVPQYVYDDLGNLLQETSPDRGTISYSHNKAGNMISKTDARDITQILSYDSLGRITAIDLPGSNEDVSYVYDTCTFGKSRLCQLTDQSGSTRYQYDAWGNTTLQTHIELGQTYTSTYVYDEGNRLNSMTYPDGRVINYSRDGIGRVIAIDSTINNTATTLTNNITYRADGLLTAQSWGNGLTESRSYDLQGRITSQNLGVTDTRTYDYDANGNMLSKIRNATTDSYGYDPLDRLTTDNTPAGNIAYSYDENGNRLTKTKDTITENLSYEVSTNRLDQRDTINYTLDAAGSITNNGIYDFTYNNTGRLHQIIDPNTSNIIVAYTYNAMGQRTRKVMSNGTTIFHYDLNGTLIAESDETGITQRTYLWNGGSPIAQINKGTSTETLIYLHTDHLATARLATNTSGNVIWAWEGEAFGNTPPNDDVDNNSEITEINLRFPGQYADAESGLNYNYFRYYDSTLGRYITSDPIGLKGGLNTYGYVDGRPLSKVDLQGLSPCVSAECIDNYVEACSASPVACAVIISPALPELIANLIAIRALQNIVDDLNEREDETPAAVPWPPKKSGKWTAICRVVDQSPDDCPTDSGKKVGFGFGIANDRTTARKQAEKMAKDVLGSSNVHHPSCKCTSPTGVHIPNCR